MRHRLNDGATCLVHAVGQAGVVRVAGDSDGDALRSCYGGGIEHATLAFCTSAAGTGDVHRAHPQGGFVVDQDVRLGPRTKASNENNEAQDQGNNGDDQEHLNPVSMAEPIDDRL